MMWYNFLRSSTWGVPRRKGLQDDRRPHKNEGTTVSLSRFSSRVKMVVVIGFGNPLLDLTIAVDNNDLLKKYAIPEDGQAEIGTGELQCLLEDIKGYKIHVSPGGCATNVLRILQWLIEEPNSTYIFGGIGDDEQGAQLQKLVEKNGVNTRYTINKNMRTGTCVALTNGTKRSLVAHLGAAEKYSVADLKSDATTELLFQSSFLYVESFFLTNRLEVSHRLLKFCKENNKTFVFNLNGVYMCKNYPEIIGDFAKSCDVLFGNKEEYMELGKGLNITGDIKKVATYLCQVPNRNKIVVVTNGSNPVLCMHSDNVTEELNVPQLNPDEFGDTTGAGDAFVAGFLNALINKQSIVEGLKQGSWTSRQIIQEIGCTIPDSSIFKKQTNL